jgi:hypothetical protein
VIRTFRSVPSVSRHTNSSFGKLLLDDCGSFRLRNDYFSDAGQDSALRGAAGTETIDHQLEEAETKAKGHETGLRSYPAMGIDVYMETFVWSLMG